MKNHKMMWRVFAMTVAFFATLILIASPVLADGKKCKGLPTEDQLQQFLRDAATNTGVPVALGGTTCIAGATGSGCVGGLFGGTRMWAAVVNRDGELCAAATSTDDPTKAWVGSQAIAKAKASTANDFSHDDAGEGAVAPAVTLPLSTANLYTLSLPGHSLFGLNNSNPFDPKCLTTPDKPDRREGKVCGGIITFGGGVSLHNSSIIGGLGVSGDTACADHEIAKRVRDLAGLNPPGGPLVDDIIFPGEGADILAHPTCINTSRNGVAEGDEVPVSIP